MPRVLATMQVEDGAKWDEGFRTHGELFKSQSVTGTIRFAVTDDNEVAIAFDVEDLDKYFEILESAATAEAMAYDGVKRETVKLFVLDREFTP